MKDEIKKELVNNIAKDLINNILIGMEEEKERFKFINAYINFIVQLKETKVNIDYKLLEDKFIIEIHKEIKEYLGDLKK